MAPTPFQAGLPTQTIIQHGTDLVTLPWYQFFLQLYNRTGGGTGSITLQLAALNGQYPGNTGNLGANPGNIGEYPTPGHGTLVPFTVSGNSYDVAHINLLDGDWDVWGSFVSTPAGGTTQSEIRAWINTASATDPGAPNAGAYVTIQQSIGAGLSQCLPVGSIRVEGGVTVYLTANVTFAGSTLTGGGFIAARRRS